MSEAHTGSEVAGDPARLIEFVNRSPVYVAHHDRDAWVGLFAADGEVNDPVGARPNVGRRAIENFYATFIEPNRIEFDVEHDIVCGASVVRDLTVHTTMSTGARMVIPMHLRYELTDSPSGLAITRLFAHWELPAMVGQLAGSGMAGARACAQLMPRLLGNQGFGGAMGFARGMRRVGRGAKHAVQEYLQQPPASLVGDCRELSWRKMIGAGNVVTVSATFDGAPAVLAFEFGGRRRIAAVRVYRDPVEN